MSRPGVVQDDGTVVVPVEEIWKRVRRWARRNGHEWVGTYGVVGVAAA